MYWEKSWEIKINNDECPYFEHVFIDFCSHSKNKGDDCRPKICNKVYCPIKV